MRGVKKNSLAEKVFFFFFIKLFCYNNFYFFFSFTNFFITKFFYLLTFQFFFPQASVFFFRLATDLNQRFFKKEVSQFFKDNAYLYELEGSDDSEIAVNTKKFFIKFLDVQVFKKKYNLEYFNQNGVLLSEKSTLTMLPFKSDIANSSYNLFVYNYAYNCIASRIFFTKFSIFLLGKTYFIYFFKYFLKVRFINFACNSSHVYITNFFFKKKFKKKNFFLYKSFFFSKKFVFFKKKNELIVNSFKIFKNFKPRRNFYFLQRQKDSFLNKYFSIFSQHFFYSFIPFGLNFFNKTNLNQKLLSALLFLPDKFLFLNYNGFIVKEKKYNNIIPLFNIKLNLHFKRKKSLPLKNTNIFLWYLLNFFESKLQKPVFLKLAYSRKAIFKKSIYSFCIRVFRKLKRYNYRFKRNFFLGEIIRIIVVSLMSRDATLFINYITWVLMQIPYKDVKGFLYFLKVILKKHLLPNFKNFFLVKGFIFDIRGKVGVTGDAKKRHTLISWGQSSFSEKNLKLSLKQGLVYTRTGVMGVTVIIIF